MYFVIGEPKVLYCEGRRDTDLVSRLGGLSFSVDEWIVMVKVKIIDRYFTWELIMGIGNERIKRSKVILSGYDWGTVFSKK